VVVILEDICRRKFNKSNNLGVLRSLLNFKLCYCLSVERMSIFLKLNEELFLAIKNENPLYPGAYGHASIFTNLCSISWQVMQPEFICLFIFYSKFLTPWDKNCQAPKLKSREVKILVVYKFCPSNGAGVN
jgi:hypothetical protein